MKITPFEDNSLSKWLVLELAQEMPAESFGCVFTHAHVGLRVEVHLNVHMPVIYFAFRVYIV